ncbi:hypothetical protein PIB30_008896 [Stylosanthes scabra]|uniref:Non-specific lipid-transfer protein n=1 Tax=Stylosanthes scabra TaxID=79078 RepID=A0ABU6Q501_9FABA|nr:hypothetical protein [Stylosanthes scabra]
MAKLAPCVVLILCMAMVGAPIAEAAIQCGFVTTNIAPCLTFLRTGGVPASPCCNGIRTILRAANDTPSRQAVCNCLKSAAASLGSQINPGNAAALPGKCGVNIPYKISTSTNCARSGAVAMARLWSRWKVQESGEGVLHDVGDHEVEEADREDGGSDNEEN